LYLVIKRVVSIKELDELYSIPGTDLLDLSGFRNRLLPIARFLEDVEFNNIKTVILDKVVEYILTGESLMSLNILLKVGDLFSKTDIDILVADDTEAFMPHFMSLIEEVKTDIAEQTKAKITKNMG